MHKEAAAVSPSTESTETFAQRHGVQPGTVRNALYTKGSYFGAVPIKLPNGRLRWPVTAAKAAQA
ncbi:DNA-binding protein [Zoogloea oleivorans]|uniref:DNA-binding protein n=1 Tax=Zoogloea oleivorans TaxID=1552750 RepID=A0A6C2D7U9_9RHOO|nr:DNA-binding protein [Zoogloea oleivorans]TYC62096.1 DNA-binding protein [Zoogloea oleivorans]